MALDLTGPLTIVNELTAADADDEALVVAEGQIIRITGVEYTPSVETAYVASTCIVTFELIDDQLHDDSILASQQGVYCSYEDLETAITPV